ESHEHRKTAADRFCLRRLRAERGAVARPEVDGFAAHPFASHSPERVCNGCARRWDFYLHGQLNIPERRRLTAIRGHADEYPRAALVVHNRARAVYRVNNDAGGALFNRG